MIRADDRVSDVLGRYPKAFEVFERHGMCEDCRESPPPVPVSHFIHRHCGGRAEEFLGELNAHVFGSR